MKPSSASGSGSEAGLTNAGRIWSYIDGLGPQSRSGGIPTRIPPTYWKGDGSNNSRVGRSDTEMALSADESRFLAEGGAAHAAAVNRRRRRRRSILAGFGAAAVIALVFAVLAYANQQRAQTEARSATARELAGSANDSLEEDPERSILLALEAVETTRSAREPVVPEAISALQRAVQTSRLVRRLPQAGSRLAVTADGLTSHYGFAIFSGRCEGL